MATTPNNIEAAKQRIAEATEVCSDWLDDDGTISTDMPPDLANHLASTYLAAPPELWEEWRQAAPQEAQAIYQWASARITIAALERIEAAAQAASAYPDGECPPRTLDELAAAFLAAPEGYRNDPRNAEAIQWAQQYQAQQQERLQDEQERRDYPRFFELLAHMKTIDREADQEASTALMLELYDCAPPRYQQEAEMLAAPYLPPTTHVDDDGHPVYSVEQIAQHFGKTPEQVAADIEHLQSKGLMDARRLHTGATHRLQ